VIKLEKSVIIKKPVTEVYAYTQNIENSTKWEGDVISVRMEEGSDNVVGSRFTEVHKFISQEMKTTMEINPINENVKWAAKVIKGPVPYDVTMIFTPVPEGTKFTISVEGEPKGFFKLADGMVINAMEKSLEADQNHLKKILEDI
jgi:uncharacterized membrane protein